MSDNQQMDKYQKGSRPWLFVELAAPNSQGFSRRVSVAEFTGEYDKLVFTNGCDLIRKDGSLARHYNIRRHPEGKGKVTHIELQGFKKVAIQKPIPQSIRIQITSTRCAVLATSSTQCDHKDGRLDDPRLSDASKVTLEDFQPLSQAANNAKRQHCRECRETGIRFDAQRLGYSVGQVLGDGKYNGTCVGCYWHDPPFFNSEVSRNYQA